MWGALSDERMGLPFTIGAFPRQRSHSWPYFTVSDSRLPKAGGPSPHIDIPPERGGPVIPPSHWVLFSSPPTTRRATVTLPVKVKVTLRLAVSQSVNLGVEPHVGLMTRYLLLFDTYGLVFVGRPLWREDGSVFYMCCWPSPGSLSRVRVPWDSWPYFTVSDLRLPFSSPPTIRSHGGGIRPRLFWESRYIATARTTQKTRHMVSIHCCVTSLPTRKCVHRAIA
jgi:hypothetical protein